MPGCQASPCSPAARCYFRLFQTSRVRARDGSKSPPPTPTCSRHIPAGVGGCTVHGSVLMCFTGGQRKWSCGFLYAHFPFITLAWPQWRRKTLTFQTFSDPTILPRTSPRSLMPPRPSMLLPSLIQYCLENPAHPTFFPSPIAPRGEKTTAWSVE